MGILSLLEGTEEGLINLQHSSKPGCVKVDPTGLRTIESPFGGFLLKTIAKDSVVRCPVSGAHLYSGDCVENYIFILFISFYVFFIDPSINFVTFDRECTRPSKLFDTDIILAALHLTRNRTQRRRDGLRREDAP